MAQYLVLDIGGTFIKYAIMDENATFLKQGKVPAVTLSEEKMLASLEELHKEVGDDYEGVAISMPGRIDTEKGWAYTGGAFTWLHDYPAAEKYGAIFGKPTTIANDGKCAALAELRDGALRGCRNASVYIIGTGVGGGLIINGEILNGSHFTAGEFSFLRLTNTDWHDPGTTAGMVCSTTGLLDLNRRFVDFSTDPLITGRQFFEKVNAGDGMSLKILRRFCMQVAMQIANLTILLDLEKVAVGGGISSQPILIETIRDCLDEIYSDPGPYFDPALPKTEIVRCRYGSEANLVGAYFNYVETR